MNNTFLSSYLSSFTVLKKNYWRTHFTLDTRITMTMTNLMLSIQGGINGDNALVWTLICENVCVDGNLHILGHETLYTQPGPCQIILSLNNLVRPIICHLIHPHSPLITLMTTHENKIYNPQPTLPHQQLESTNQRRNLLL